jgi:hypothetical protein
MAKYRLTKNPAYVAANGHPVAQHFKPGSVIEVADDLAPSETWIPLDDAARTAKAAQEARQPCVTAVNGVQSIDRRTGTVRVTRHNERTPRADPPKPGRPAAALPEPRHLTAADHVAERQAAFKGKELPETHAGDLETESLRRAIERGR